VLPAGKTVDQKGPTYQAQACLDNMAANSSTLRLHKGTGDSTTR